MQHYSDQIIEHRKSIQTIAIISVFTLLIGILLKFSHSFDELGIEKLRHYLGFSLIFLSSIVLGFYLVVSIKILKPYKDKMFPTYYEHMKEYFENLPEEDKKEIISYVLDCDDPSKFIEFEKKFEKIFPNDEDVLLNLMIYIQNEYDNEEN